MLCLAGIWGKKKAIAVIRLIAAGQGVDEVLRLYPYLEKEDMQQALAYAAWRAEEIGVPTGSE